MYRSVNDRSIKAEEFNIHIYIYIYIYSIVKMYITENRPQDGMYL